MAEVPRARVLRTGRRRVGGVGVEPSRAGLRLVWLARVESVWLVQKEVVFWTPGFCEPSDLGWDEGGLWALCPGLAEKSARRVRPIPITLFGISFGSLG